MMNTKVSPVEWVGRLIDQRFPLFEWLGSAESGEVFRTELPGQHTQKAAIRLVPAEIDGAQDQFDDWAQAEGLSHPNLLRIFDSGHGRIDENEFLYVVTELPEETLAQVVPTRSLSGPEAAEMLPPILDALAYLHSVGLVHGRLSPASILVVEDRVKLSADTLQHSGRPRRFQNGLRLYQAPEVARGVISPESDIWSLGITLVEALTQLPPMRNSPSGAPGVPQFMPEPFAEIARQCLRLDPAQRATVDEIREALRVPSNRTAPVPLTAPAPAPPPQPLARVAAAAPPPPKPEPAQLPPEPAQIQSPQSSLAFDDLLPAARSPRSTEEEEFPRSRTNTPFIVGLAALLVVLIAALFIRSHRSAPAPDTPATAPAPAPQASTPPPAPAPTHRSPTTSAPKPAASIPKPAASTPAPQPPPPQQPAPASSSGARGAVEERVMPEDRAHGERTIHGKVSVRVRVEVNPAGRVSNASFESEGPSRYFGKIALEAARKWTFRPPQSNSGPQPSTWILRFDFRRGRTDVSEAEVSR